MIVFTIIAVQFEVYYSDWNTCMFQFFLAESNSSLAALSGSFFSHLPSFRCNISLISPFAHSSQHVTYMNKCDWGWGVGAECCSNKKGIQNNTEFTKVSFKAISLHKRSSNDEPKGQQVRHSCREIGSKNALNCEFVIVFYSLAV